MNKKHNLILALIFTVIVTNSVFSQTLNYQINRSTGKISNVEKFKLQYIKAYSYDIDFEEKGQSQYTDFKVSFELDNSGRGKMIIQWDDNGKIYLTIESCFKNTYSNSNKDYWKFKCLNEYGAIFYYYLEFSESGTYGEFWIPMDNNTRMYFFN